MKESALESERRKKAEAKVAEREKQVVEAKKQAIQDFKASRKLEDIKIEFAEEAFGKGFDLCQQKVAERFPDLDLGFLMGDSSKDEVEPPTAGADLPYAKSTTTEPAEPTPTPTKEIAPAEATSSSSTAPPS